MAVTIGSGLGGFTAIAAQPTYGSGIVTPARTLTFKQNTFTFDPHPVQGGPYLAGGRMVDIGSARVLIYLDAKGTLSGDMVNTGQALLLATAMGSSATLTQMGTTTAYQLGGAAGALIGAPDKNNGGASGCCFDMQSGVPTVDGTQQKYTFHSTMITKATWVFDRTGLVTYSYDWDAQYVDTTTALITPSYAAAPVPFSMANSNSVFKVGTFGAESQLDGIRKATIVAEHKLDTNRIYLGDQFKSLPISNERIDITVTLDTDYIPASKTSLFDIFLTGATVPSVVCSAYGNAIGASGQLDQFTLNATNCFVQSGADPDLQGPDIVKKSIVLKGTLDAAADSALIAKLVGADTTF